MNALLVGDLHLTTQLRDDYRWRIFARLRKDIELYKPECLILLGDLTDAKDKHPAELVNRICDELITLRIALKGDIHIVRGNHDGIDPTWPYFGFLAHLSQIHFYAAPAEMHGHRDALVLPHSRDPLKEWSDIKFDKYKIVFAHVTVRGAESESGHELRSTLGSDYFKKRNVRVYSGDVHVPQTLGPVVYVGAPYPIRFGDSFMPRFVLLRGKTVSEIAIGALLRRAMLDVKDADEVSKVKLSRGDQVKVRLHLAEDGLHTWQKQRKEIVAICKKRALELVSVEVIKESSGQKTVLQKIKTRTPAATLQDYVKRQEVEPKLAEVGKGLLQ